MCELKPCPFCGSEGELRSIYYRETSYRDAEISVAVHCSRCTATVEGKSWETAILGWNNRAKLIHKGKLKSCAFCGGEAKVEKPGYVAPIFRDRFVVQCQKCTANTEANSYDLAIKEWNRRAEND